MWGARRGWGRRLAADEKGAALVEFALIAPLFFLLLIGILQFGVLGMVSANFDVAVQGISRKIRTGQDDKPTTAAAFRTLICSKMVDPSCASRLQVAVQPFKSASQAMTARTAQDPNDLTKGEPFDAGAAGDIVLVTATYKWPLVMPFSTGAFGAAGGANVVIVSRLVFRNEPFEDD